MAEKKETKKQELNELVYIQSTLKAPKNQRNTFGGYNYRSCEDIMEAVKPLLKDTNCTLVISDEIVQVADRIYVKSTATLKTPSGEEFKNTAYAREALSKKGMDESQVTGAASSYARKYALNGLFCIDDVGSVQCHPAEGVIGEYLMKFIIQLNGIDCTVLWSPGPQSREDHLCDLLFQGHISQNGCGFFTVSRNRQ